MKHDLGSGCGWTKRRLQKLVRKQDTPTGRVEREVEKNPQKFIGRLGFRLRQKKERRKPGGEVKKKGGKRSGAPSAKTGKWNEVRLWPQVSALTSWKRKERWRPQNRGRKALSGLEIVCNLLNWIKRR